MALKSALYCSTKKPRQLTKVGRYKLNTLERELFPEIIPMQSPINLDLGYKSQSRNKLDSLFPTGPQANNEDYPVNSGEAIIRSSVNGLRASTTKPLSTNQDIALSQTLPNEFSQNPLRESIASGAILRQGELEVPNKVTSFNEIADSQGNAPKWINRTMNIGSEL